MRYTINKNKYLNAAELLYLTSMTAKDGSRNGLLIKLALATGARAQELLNLTKADLDIENQTIFIKGLKNSNDRDIPLEKSLFNALLALPLKENDQRLFPIGYDRLNDIWAFWTPNKTKTFHSLRHTFAIELYRRTKDLLLVQAALGHRNIQNSLVYTEHLYQNEYLKGILA